jgi:hypothetical protein
VKTEQSLGPPPTQRPAWQVSPTLQNVPSLQTEPFGSGAVHDPPEASVQLSAQFPSPSAPGQGLPACTRQPPAALHLSVPLQKSPSLHTVLRASGEQVPAVAGLALHDMQSAAPPAHALVQHTPSTHVKPLHIAVLRQLPPTPSFV